MKLDDLAVDHPKIAALSDRAFRAWIDSLSYAARHQTDGVLPAAYLRRVAPRTRRELVERGCWEANGSPDSLLVHDYLEYQPSAASVQAERAAAAERVKRWRERQRGGETT